MASGKLIAQQPARTITFTDSFTPSPLFFGTITKLDGQFVITDAQSLNFPPLTYTGLPFVLLHTNCDHTVIGDGGNGFAAMETTRMEIYLVLGGVLG